MSVSDRAGRETESSDVLFLVRAWGEFDDSEVSEQKGKTFYPCRRGWFRQNVPTEL